jgi:hypothetical protein
MSDKIRVSILLVGVGVLVWMLAILGVRSFPPTLMAFSLGILVRPLLDRLDTEARP